MRKRIEAVCVVAIITALLWSLHQGTPQQCDVDAPPRWCMD